MIFFEVPSFNQADGFLITKIPQRVIRFWNFCLHIFCLLRVNKLVEAIVIIWKRSLETFDIFLNWVSLFYSLRY